MHASSSKSLGTAQQQVAPVDGSSRLLRCVRSAMCLAVAAGAMGLGLIGGQFDHMLPKLGLGQQAHFALMEEQRHAARGGFVPYSTGACRGGVRVIHSQPADELAQAELGMKRVQIPRPGSLEHVCLQLCALRDGGFAAEEGFASSAKASDDDEALEEASR